MSVVRFAPVEGEYDERWLTAAERTRRERLVQTPDRTAFVASHVLVRECAAALLDAEPQDVVIAHRCRECGGEDHGMPYVVGADLHVSLSHTRNWVAAVAAASPCGIDVQEVGHVPDRALTEAELAWAGEDAERRTLLWSRKEALAKAGLADVGAFWEQDVQARDPRIRDWADDGVVGAWVIAGSEAGT